MRSAGINFGIPQCEWNIAVDEDGSNPRCWNPVTGEELGGGGSDVIEVTINPGTYENVPITTVASSVHIKIGEDSIYFADSVQLDSPYILYLPKYTNSNALFMASGTDENGDYNVILDGAESTISGDIVWDGDVNNFIITGNCTIDAKWILD